LSDADAIQAESVLQERLYAIDLQALQDKEAQLDGNLEKIAQNNAAIEQAGAYAQNPDAAPQKRGPDRAEQGPAGRHGTPSSPASESSIAGMIQGTNDPSSKGLRPYGPRVLAGFFAQFIAKKVVMWANRRKHADGGPHTGGQHHARGQRLVGCSAIVMASAWSADQDHRHQAWEVAASVYAAIAGIP